MTKRRNILLAALAAAALALTGCSGSPAPARTDGTGTLTVGFNTPPVSLDPLKSANGQGRWYEDPAYSSVLNVDKDGTVIAGLADKWGYVGDDLKKFSFTLRPDLVFADGTPLDAQAVVNSFTYFKENGSGPTRAYYLGITAEAVDDLTVELTSETPNPIMDILLGPDFYAFSPISAAGLADDNARAAGTFGSGPYVLDASATVSGDKYTYVKNPTYYDPEAAHWEKIVIEVIPNATQLVQALKTGQVQVIMADASVADIPVGDNIEKIARNGNWSGLIITDRNGVNAPALADPRVRQALAFALDREGLAKAALGEYGTASQLPTLPGDPTWGYDESLDHNYDQDLDKAKELLAEAGYPDGFEFSLIYQSSSPTDTKMAEGIASQLAQIGVTMTLKGEPDFGSWVNDFVSGQYSATVFGNVGLPMYLLAQFFWTPTAIMNPYGVSDPDLNEAFDALSAAPADQQEATAAAVTKVVVDKALSIAILQGQIIYLYDDSLKGVDWIGGTGNLSSIVDWS